MANQDTPRRSKDILYRNTEIPPEAKTELLDLIYKFKSTCHDRLRALETLKTVIANALGTTSNTSSSESWAETDFESLWHDTYRPCVAGRIEGMLLAMREISITDRNKPSPPDTSTVAKILARHNSPITISNGWIVLSRSVDIEMPDQPNSPAEKAQKFMDSAENIRSTDGYACAVDRVHSALHSLTKAACDKHGVDYADDASLPKLFKSLRKNSPQLGATPDHSHESARVANSLANAIDALGTIRNRNSMAHPNKLLNDADAELSYNACRTIYKWILSKEFPNNDSEASTEVPF